MSTTCTEFGITLAISSKVGFPALGIIFKCEVMDVKGALGLVLVPYKLAWFCFLHRPGGPQSSSAPTSSSSPTPSQTCYNHQCLGTMKVVPRLLPLMVRAFLPPLSMLNLPTCCFNHTLPVWCECRCTHLCTTVSTGVQPWVSALSLRLLFISLYIRLADQFLGIFSCLHL